jgi:hypothetical protein
MADKLQCTGMRSPNTPLFFKLYIVLFPIQDIPDEGHYLFRKGVGSALTETENWDLLVDCTSRDGRKMLDAGVHLSDKGTLLMNTPRPLHTKNTIFYRICLCFNNGEETTDSIIS